MNIREKDAPGDGCYSVAVLGDTHFDAEPESLYHSNYDESNKYAAIQHEEFRRNGEMWRGRCRDLVAAAGALASGRPTRFVLQLGDLIQGDCDDPPTHTRMLDDCIRMLRAPFPAGLPFITVMGNHDFRGKGAREAYLMFAEPFLSAEIASLTGRPAAPAQYPAISFRLGPDLWLLCDFEHCPPDTISDAIDAAPDARHAFLVTHGPFTPPDDKFWRWRLGCRTQGGRERLYETLSRRRAVVLSGHSHLTVYNRHENRFGGFCEFSANAVWKAPELATAEPQFDSPEQYGARTRGLLSGDDLAAFDADFAPFRAGLREYFVSTAAGHCRLDVGDDHVTMSFYPGASREPGRVFELFHP